MSEYPDPDEEYEMMYADEFELIRETEENTEPNNPKKKITNQAKRSLDFSSPSAKKSLTQTLAKDLPLTPAESLPFTPNLPLADNILTPQNNYQTPEQTKDSRTSSENLSPIVTQKRTADELFGDINDIDFEEPNLPSKRVKTEEEIDSELIDRIIQGRQLKQMLAEPVNRGGAEKSVYNAKENISLDVPRWSFMPVTSSEGERYYVRLESEHSFNHGLHLDENNMSFLNSYQSVLEEARSIIEKKKQEAEEEKKLSQQSQQLIHMDQGNFGTQLWVEKYKPISYVDLLSDEPVNRALLHWLHLWDKIVFNKEVKTKDPLLRNSFSKRAGQFQLTNKWKGKKEAEPEVGEDGRPTHKVALVCGPPGVGKTTLAHLLARVAGYRPVELNASDERSTESFRHALQSATLMTAVLDSDRRPNCLILDEIDGAPLPTVELLVKWCTATKETGKKKTKTQPLKRPVIAICNDLYAASLRPLRPVALIIRVPGAHPSRVSARVWAVCARESVRVTPRVITALVTKTNGDVRAALTLLSFIKAKAKSELTMEDVLNSNIGEKDCSKNLMQALQSVFTVNDGSNPIAACARVISACGEYDRTAEGIFENYLTARVDSRLQVACETMSWLLVYDEINSFINRSQNYSLYGMLSTSTAATHGVLASRNPPKLKFPQVGQEMYRKKTEMEAIVSSISKNILPSVAPSSKRALLLDVIALLPHVLAPKMRTANIQLCPEGERQAVVSAARAQLDYGLAYAARLTDGGPALALEPDIYKAAFFGNEDRFRPPPTVRQAIAREQQLELIRRNETHSGRASSSQPVKPKAPTMDVSKDPQTAHLPNHLQRLKPKEVDRKAVPQVHKDFFGRVVPMISCSQRPDAVRDVISSSSVFYQYREGFNNAVRRAVRIRDLL